MFQKVNFSKMIEFVKTIVLVIIIAFASCIFIVCKKVLGLCNLCWKPPIKAEYVEESLILYKLSESSQKKGTIANKKTDVNCQGFISWANEISKINRKIFKPSGSRSVAASTG